MASSFGWPSFEIKISNLANFALLLHPVMGCLSHHGTDHAHGGAAGGHEGEGEEGGEENGAVTPSTNHAPPAHPSTANVKARQVVH